MSQYRRSDAPERQQQGIFGALRYGLVFIATEHALALLDVSLQVVLWGPIGKPPRSYYMSERFKSVYGMDTLGYQRIYLAGGREGVLVLRGYIPRMGVSSGNRFVVQDRLTELPGATLDVGVADEKLYILCGTIDPKLGAFR